MYSFESSVEEILGNPIGSDIVELILDRISERFYPIINLNIVRKMKLKHILYLKKDKKLEEIIKVIIHKMNEFPIESLPKLNDRDGSWWRDAVIYQIYPRSFMDSNNDGIGDIRGIISKLPYLKWLGVDALWLCPFFDSPNDDNGYDIRNYKKIGAEYGEMEDLEELIRLAHKHDIRIVMDLVLNHSSDEHSWFKRALRGEEEYKRYYYFRKKEDINNWTSLFSGSAWEQVSDDEYYLHLFSKKQPDFDWTEVKLREKLIEIANWWCEKGIDGFRLDVINFISKRNTLPHGNEDLGKITGFVGLEHYLNGPEVHKYLREINRKVFAPKGIFTVGECNGLGLKTAQYFIHRDRKELSTAFSFNHMDMSGKNKWDIYEYKLQYLVKSLIKIQNNTHEGCIFSLFTENHDSSRFAPKVSGIYENRKKINKSICGLLMFMKGIPFIYQGQELGMDNPKFNEVNQLKDVESRNKYESLLEEGVQEDEALRRVLRGARDNSRIPIKWNEGEYGGFSEIKPWLWCPIDSETECVEKQMKDSDSVLRFYKRAIDIRKKYSALVYGDMKVKKMNSKVLEFEREDEENKIICLVNMKDTGAKCSRIKGKEILSNYPQEKSLEGRLRPYEFRVHIVKK